MIHMFQPSVGDEELDAIKEVFDSNWLGYGPGTQAFEKEFAEHLGGVSAGVSKESVLFINSATSGLHLAMELLDVGPGDEVVVPSVSFIANANSIVARGARPAFCDVDPRTLNPTVADIEAAITPRTKAVTVLHYGGQPGEIIAISALCKRLGIPLIEDAACSVGSSVHGRACGTFSDIAIWSFDSRKIITTGDGGMIYVRDPELARAAHRLAYHGLEDRGAFATAAKQPHRWWDLTVHGIGRRLIGNDVTAAIGRVQLRRLPSFIARRGELAAQYNRLLAGVDGITLPPALPEGHHSTNYFYWVRLDPEIRDEVAQELLRHDIYTTFRYPPLHQVPLYGVDVDLPGTDEAAASILLLPLHQALTDAQVGRVADELRAAVGRRTHRAAA